jgi:hypothetical protein
VLIPVVAVLGVPMARVLKIEMVLVAHRLVATDLLYMNVIVFPIVLLAAI